MLRLVALISAVYDISVGLTLFFLRPFLLVWFGVPVPQPPIHADLNAVFVTVVGLGYLLPLWDPDRYRALLWLFGPILKGAGALLFVADFMIRDSPASYLVFAACDGGLAVATLLVLLAWPATALPSSHRGT
jgi:hypothetical protein